MLEKVLQKKNIVKEKEAHVAVPSFTLQNQERTDFLPPTVV